MIWIGLTGGIGSGKSSVTARLRARGYAVIDADELSRQVLEEDQSLLARIKESFGTSVFNTQGVLDRQALGRVVFGQKARLDELEAIMHPAIRKKLAMEREKLEESGESLAFYDIPLLFEKGLEKDFDQIVVVTAPESVRVARVAVRDNLSDAEIRSRIRAQLPLETKVEAAGFVIDNSGTLSELDQQIAKLERYLQDQT